MVPVGKLRVEKKVAIVYNPNSGKKRDVRGQILEILKDKCVEYQVHETQGYMDAWKYVQNVEIDDLSCIVAVGGDGTIHEVVNGLMTRSDGKKVPLAFVPNGSGNDTCGSIGINNIDQALQYIRKGDTIQMDLNKVLVDCESETEIPPQELDHNRLRYSIVNSSAGFLAKCVDRAIKHKTWAGNNAYIIAAAEEFLLA